MGTKLQYYAMACGLALGIATAAQAVYVIFVSGVKKRMNFSDRESGRIIRQNHVEKR